MLRGRITPKALCIAVLAAVLAGGCGATTHRASLAIRQRVLRTNDLAGFQPSRITTFPTLAAWLAGDGQPAGERAMLRRDGFRGGVLEYLSHDGTQGLSLVERLGSAQGARDALAFYVNGLKQPGSTAGRFARLTVTGIPGAVGFSLGGAGINIAFTSGDYYYEVGREGADLTAVTDLTAAARDLYTRVHGTE